ncbi:GGDEF domain-containing protein [Iodidimonas nitroreducens]|uniref:diguanylate cyclase n=1 Tax=Iodidimonas nitroreducens TaxID=1236968 RepID=A0A5A7N4F2_9PROT|nr:GGDEF domain-containing protein [Iodidimonas nitroreducens]GAK32364.1 putative protein [alpha proteobacterium Q-1]GER03153.1 GGDEF domain-containing protein [Iodidimonas nitroreducens]
MYDGLDQAEEFAQSALALMKQHKIPPTPQNYQIWYSYATGRNQSLKTTIDVLISNSCDFNEDRNAEIAEQYFGSGRGSREVHEATERLETIAKTILTHVQDTKAGSQKFGKRVASLSTEAGNLASGDEIKRLALGLLKEARAITEISSSLEKNLSVTGCEITELRSSLVQMRKDATTDPLTGLANRREFLNVLKASAMDAAESGETLSLIMMDIDHFKEFNDRYGHKIGDEVLKIVAAKLKLTLKGKDLPVRYGGEEFIAILPQTSTESAMTVAEHIRQSISASALKNRLTSESYGKITASFGVASFIHGERLDDFIQRADEALYRAKRDGRNRIEMALDSQLQQFG